MKFVKGDAIAGLIITLVNLLAGIVVGVLYHSMTAGEAANRFAVLSIGDAMVSQLPSLFICVAAGVLITRVADEHEKKPRSLGQEISAQLTRTPRAMYLAAVLTLAFALVPGFPALQFMALAAALAATAHILGRARRKEEANVISKPISALQREGGKGDAPAILLQPPHFAKPLAIRMSRPLGDLLEADRLDVALESERSKLQAHLGLPFPGAAMWVSGDLEGHSFDVLLNDVPTSRHEVPGRMLLVLDSASPLASGAERHGPILGKGESLWLPPTAVPEAQRGGSCLDLEHVIAAQVFDVLRRHAHMFMGVQEVQWVIDRVVAEYPGLVAEVQKILPLQRIAEVMRRLLEEQVPIRNVRSIFESLIAWGPKEKDMLLLTEYVRGDLGRYLAFEASAGSGQLGAILLDPGIEQAIRQCIKPTPAGNYLAMPPENAMALTDRIAAIAGAPAQGVALVTSMDIRRYVRKMIEARLDWLRVYSFQELGSLIELRPIGRVTG